MKNFFIVAGISAISLLLADLLPEKILWVHMPWFCGWVGGISAAFLTRFNQP